MGIQNDNTNNETQKVFPVCYTVALWTWQGRAGEIGIPLLETTKNRRASVFTSRNAERPWEEECQGYHETVLVSRRFWATVSYAFIGGKHVKKWSTLIGGCWIVEKQNPSSLITFWCYSNMAITGRKDASRRLQPGGRRQALSRAKMAKPIKLKSASTQIEFISCSEKEADYIITELDRIKKANYKMIVARWPLSQAFVRESHFEFWIRWKSSSFVGKLTLP